MKPLLMPTSLRITASNPCFRNWQSKVPAGRYAWLLVAASLLPTGNTVMAKTGTPPQERVVPGQNSKTAPKSSIRGFITDAKTHQPVKFATVRIRDSHFVTRADSTGFFSITAADYRDKEVTLVIGALGYKPVEYKVAAAKKRKPFHIGMTYKLPGQ